MSTSVLAIFYKENIDEIWGHPDFITELAVSYVNFDERQARKLFKKLNEIDFQIFIDSFEELIFEGADLQLLLNLLRKKFHDLYRILKLDSMINGMEFVVFADLRC